MKITKISPVCAGFYASMMLALIIMIQVFMILGAWLLLFEVMEVDENFTAYFKFYI